MAERDALPAIYFIFSRRGCDKGVKELGRASLVTPAEQARIQARLDLFVATTPEAVREGGHAEALLRGIASHHAGVLPAWKDAIGRYCFTWRVYRALVVMDLAFNANVLLQYWHDADPPPLLCERMNKWEACNPDFQHLVFNRDSAATALTALYGESFGQAFLAIRLPAMQADIFRVAYLYACGGIWIDAATHCLAPLHQWLDLGAQLRAD
jgi:hypothetical protein